jgi:hypothetical protein
MTPDSVVFSTNYDKTFATENILRIFELQYEDGSVEERIDWGDWRITQILRKITVARPYKYNGIRKFTTLCQAIYGNTTCYRLVMIYNGYMHPYEIPAGAIILFPDNMQLSDAIRQVTQIKNVVRSVLF